MARQHTSTALETLLEVAMASDSDAARVSAANALLDRGYGKPPQPMEHAGPGGGPIEYRNLDEAEIDARLAMLDAKHGPSRLAH